MRIRTIGVALSALVLASLTAGTAAAQPEGPASPYGQDHVVTAPADISIQSTDIFVTRIENGNLIGDGAFNADPVGSIPGDAIQACDDFADGWGIETQLDINYTGGTFVADRIATTRGHDSPFCSGWVSGNITEETPVAIRLCKVKGTSRTCFSIFTGRA